MTTSEIWAFWLILGQQLGPFCIILQIWTQKQQNRSIYVPAYELNYYYYFSLIARSRNRTLIFSPSPHKLDSCTTQDGLSLPVRACYASGCPLFSKLHCLVRRQPHRCCFWSPCHHPSTNSLSFTSTPFKYAFIYVFHSSKFFFSRGQTCLMDPVA